jgi:hypothetical protein
MAIEGTAKETGGNCFCGGRWPGCRLWTKPEELSPGVPREAIVAYLKGLTFKESSDLLNDGHHFWGAPAHWDDHKRFIHDTMTKIRLGYEVL